MKASIKYLSLLSLLFVTSIGHTHGLPDFTALVEQTNKAVVNISTTRKLNNFDDLRDQLPRGFELPEGAEGPLGELLKRFFGDKLKQFEQPFEQGPQPYSLGSGFIISADGYIITNNHVVSEADEIIVRLSDRRELHAKVIGTDARSDIALIKVDAKSLPVVKLGNIDDLNVGEWVLAIGSPFGFDYSVTAGIVSAKGRNLPNENYVPFIQTDVAINPGNSGGPLFNLKGEVVGVNSQIYSRTGGFMGLSFSIPIDMAMDVVQQLKDNGHVSRGWLGVLIQEVTRELAESFGLSKPEGALISKVIAGSPADKGGLRVGDIVLSFQDKEVQNSASLPPMVGKLRAGQSARVKILRNGQLKVLTIAIGELPEPDKLAVKPSNIGNKSSNHLGMVVEPLSDTLKEEYNLASGVVVVEVEPGPAADSGIRQGDIITQLNNKPVKGVGDFVKKLNTLKPGASVPLLIQRANGPVFIALRILKNE